MKQSRLRVLQLGRHVSRHSEVRVLVDGTRYQTRDVLLTVEDERKTARKRRRRLHGGKVNLADGIGEAKTKDALHLVECHLTLDLQYYLVKLGRSSVLEIDSIRTETKTKDITYEM